MNFGQLKSRVIGTVDSPGLAFPQGPPENLLTVLADRLVEGMIEVQRWIPCYQQGHTDVFPSCSLMFQNGTSVLTKPQGEIERVYTIGAEEGGWDNAVPYSPVELQQLRRWMSKFRQNSRWIYRTPKPISGSEGFITPSSDLDSPAGRSLLGVYSIDKRSQRMIVGPWLQSNEKLVVEWTGMKRTWGDEDLIPENPEFVRLIRLWLSLEFGRDWSSPDLATRQSSFDNAQADQMVTCNRENQLNGPMADDAEGKEVAYSFRSNPPVEAPAAVDDIRICFVGDTGTANANAQAVATAIIAKNPDMVVLLGDAVYQPNTVAQALAPYQSLIDAGKLVVTLGNHDLDLGITAVPEYVGSPGNGRYFSVPLGPVEIFVADSGLNTAGDNVEPDGAFAGSAQWTNLQGWIGRSCARWKLLTIHHAPYTSGTRYAPGIESMRWASNMEVNAVLSGHSHNYERGTFLGRRHFVVGTGGSDTVDGFIATPVEGSEFRSSEYGFLMLDADRTSARYRFMDTSGNVIDDMTATDDLGPAIPIGPTPGVPPSVTQFAEFQTLAEMLASTSSWQRARVMNWDPADGVISVWEKITTSPAPVIPNGTDILLNVLGQVVFRTFSRESTGSEVIIPPSNAAVYSAGFPVGFPTYDDLVNSRIATDWVFSLDSQGTAGVFRKVAPGPVHNGVDIIVNASGVTYVRTGFL